jgi:transcriptional regulator GlxA family with amidase domain
MSTVFGYQSYTRPFASTIIARARPTPSIRRDVPDDWTDTSIIDSVCVARAVAYVRHHLSEVFGVEAVLQAAGVPRRSLELAFRAALGCTPYQFITRARLARAKELLASEPPQKLSEIARACGFADLRRFRLVFRRELGVSPAEHRAARRLVY